MHTSEQAKGLWCPMARVVQVGAVETQASYNRALSKTHIPVIVAQAVEPGQDLTPTPATMLKMESNPSTAAMCLGEKCAMWRWGDDAPVPEFVACWPANARSEAEPSAERVTRGIKQMWKFCAYNEADGYPAGWLEPAEMAERKREGYCGLAGAPGVTP